MPSLTMSKARVPMTGTRPKTRSICGLRNRMMPRIEG